MKIGKIFESLLNEIEKFPYKLNTNDPKRLRAKFDTDGLNYTVNMWHDENMHNFGEYELSFGVASQRHEGERQGRDIKHLNNVLYTVTDIAEELSKQFKIKKIKIDGASDEKDDGGMFADTLRGRIYTRFLKNRYPDDAVEPYGRFIYLDMTKVFPEIIKDEKGKADMLIDLLVGISDADPNEEGIRRGLSGENDDNFGVSTDFIQSSKYGTIFLGINVNGGWGEYSIEWDLLDQGDEGMEDFDSFEGLINFIKTKFK
jgi:hypothetical protein